MTNKTQENAVKPRRVRGTATFHDDTGCMEFRATQPSEPIQRNAKKKGASTFYETDGSGQSSYICHLKVDKSVSDPAAEMMEQLEYLTKDIQVKEYSKPRGKALLNTPEVSVYHNRKENKIKVQMTIDLNNEGELSAKLFTLTSEVNKCLAFNQTSLQKPKK